MPDCFLIIKMNVIQTFLASHMSDEKQGFFTKLEINVIQYPTVRRKTLYLAILDRLELI